MIQWLTDSPHGFLWGVCLFIPFVAACLTLIDDEEQRHSCIAFCAALLLTLLAFIGFLELTDHTLEDIVRRRRNLLGFRSRNPYAYLLISAWVISSYFLSRKLLHLFYRWRDRRGDEDDSDCSED